MHRLVKFWDFVSWLYRLYPHDYIYLLCVTVWWHPLFLECKPFCFIPFFVLQCASHPVLSWWRVVWMDMVLVLCLLYAFQSRDSQVWICFELFCGLSMLSLNLLTVFIVNKQECHGSILIPHFSCWNQWNLIFLLVHPMIETREIWYF